MTIHACSFDAGFRQQIDNAHWTGPPLTALSKQVESQDQNISTQEERNNSESLS